MLEWTRFILTAALILGGLFLLATSVIGQFRLQYVLNRMHAASMCDSLALLMIVCGLCLNAPDFWVIVKFLMVVCFMWVTSPTGGHLIARLELTLNEHPEEEMEVVQK